MVSGPYTNELVQRLASRFCDTPYRVFYDPHKRVYPHIEGATPCHPTPFFGELSSASTLSWVDVAILDASTNKVVLVVEVEESGAEPKRVIGDIVNIALSDKISLPGSAHECRTPLEVLLGIKTKQAGKQEAKVSEIVARLLTTFGHKVSVTPLLSESLANLIDDIDRAVLSKLNLS